MSIRAVLTAIVGLLVALVVGFQPATAGAAGGTATILDDPDPRASFDIAEARVNVDRGTGTIQLVVRFHRPVPALGLPVNRTVQADIANAEPRDCGLTEGLGDVRISLWSETDATLTIAGGPEGRAVSSLVPVAIASDRLSFSLTVSREELKQTTPRCFSISGGGTAAYDLTTPVWFDGLGPAVSDPPAAPPAACDVPLLGLSGPDELAVGSRGPVVVESSHDEQRSLAPGATLTVADDKSGKVYYRRDLTRHDLSALGEEARVTRDYMVGLAPSHRSAVATLTWHQRYQQDEVGTCTAIAGIKAVRGKTPSFYARGGGSGRLIARGQSCWEYSGKRVTVSVTAAGRTARFVRRSACGSFSGRTRNVGALRVGHSGYGTIDFDSRGSGSARVTVTVGGKVKLRRTVVSRVRSRPDRLIFEGTDAFVNYCINQRKQLYSYQLELYCIRPGSYSEAVRFRR